MQHPARAPKSLPAPELQQRGGHRHRRTGRDGGPGRDVTGRDGDGDVDVTVTVTGRGRD